MKPGIYHEAPKPRQELRIRRRLERIAGLDIAKCAAILLVFLASLGEASGIGRAVDNPSWQFGTILLCASAGGTAAISWRRWGEAIGRYRSHLGRRLTRLAPTYLLSLGIFLLVTSTESMLRGTPGVTAYPGLLNPLWPSEDLIRANPSWWIMQAILTGAITTPLALWCAANPARSITAAAIVAAAVMISVGPIWIWHCAMVGSFFLGALARGRETRAIRTATVASCFVALLFLSWAPGSQPAALGILAACFGMVVLLHRRVGSSAAAKGATSQAAYPFLLLHPLLASAGSAIGGGGDMTRTLAILGLVCSIPASIAIAMLMEARVFQMGEDDADMTEDMFGSDREMRDNRAGKGIFGND